MDPSHKCPNCDIPFRFQKDLEQHTATAHPEGAYFCDVCSKQFLKISALLRHKKQRHGDPVPCTHPGCSQVFKTAYELKDHRAFHSAPKFVCSKGCDQKFHLVRNWRKHERLHAAKMVRCNPCSLVYKNKESFRTHCRNKHKNQPEPLFTELTDAERDSVIQTGTEDETSTQYTTGTSESEEEDSSEDETTE